MFTEVLLSLHVLKTEKNFAYLGFHNYLQHAICSEERLYTTKTFARLLKEPLYYNIKSSYVKICLHGEEQIFTWSE